MRRRSMGRWLAALAVASLALAGGVDALRAQEVEPDVPAPPARALTVWSGNQAYLGVRIRDVDAERASAAGLEAPYGAFVETVTEEGPAARAGIREGDVIAGWNGSRVESVAQLQRLVRETPAGRTVSLTVVREGRTSEVDVELGDRSEELEGNLRVFTVPRDRPLLRERAVAPLRERIRVEPGEGIRLHSFFAGRPRLGVSIQSMGEQLAGYFGVEGGALITSVNEDSPAAAAGLRAGDVIVSIGGEDVEDPSDVRDILSGREAGPVEVRVVRDGTERGFTVELEEASGPGAWGGMYMGPDAEGLRLWHGDADGVHIEPFEVSVEPFHMEGFEIAIPPIELPHLDVPDIHIPPIEIPELHVPGIRVTTGAIEID